MERLRPQNLWFFGPQESFGMESPNIYWTEVFYFWWVFEIFGKGECYVIEQWPTFDWCNFGF
jgi:hypothetical protein